MISFAGFSRETFLSKRIFALLRETQSTARTHAQIPLRERIETQIITWSNVNREKLHNKFMKELNGRIFEYISERIQFQKLRPVILLFTFEPTSHLFCKKR